MYGGGPSANDASTATMQATAGNGLEDTAALPVMVTASDLDRQENEKIKKILRYEN